MRHSCAALAAWLLLLALPAGATTAWNTDAALGNTTRICDDGPTTCATPSKLDIKSDVPRWWKAGDTAASPIIFGVPRGGAYGSWYGGATAVSLTVYFATGSTGSPGTWNVYDVYPSGTSCGTYPGSCFWLSPGYIYKVVAGDDGAGNGTTTSDSQLRLMGSQ